MSASQTPVSYTHLDVYKRQEQGIIKLRAGSGAALPELPLGTKLRIVPNHACATCAQHDAYAVVRGGDRRVVAQWQRFRGW